MLNLFLTLILSVSTDPTPIDRSPVMHKGEPAILTTYSDGSTSVRPLGCPGCAGGYARSEVTLISGSQQLLGLISVEVGNVDVFNERRGQCYPLQEWNTCNPGTAEEDKCKLTVRAQVSVPSGYVGTIWVFDHTENIWGMSLPGERSYWTIPFTHSSQCGSGPATERKYTAYLAISPFAPTMVEFYIRARCLPCEQFVR